MNENKSQPNPVRKLNYGRRVGYFFIAAILVISALYVVPIETYESNVILFSAIFGILIAYFLFQSLYDYRSEDWNSQEEGTNNYSILWLSLFVVAIPIFLIIFQSNRKDNVLFNDGITTKATIVDLISYKVKRSSMFEAKVRYLDNKGVEHLATGQIEEADFNLINRGAEIDILYSPSNPDLIRLLNSKYNREKFNIKNADLGMGEEEKLPKDKEGLQALIKKLEIQIIKEKDKIKQIEIIAKISEAKYYLKELEKRKK